MPLTLQLTDINGLLNKTVMNLKEPTYFSDYFKIDKSVLNKFDVFDPILNIDTKVFVEPLLLKSSASEIIKNAYQTYKQFFTILGSGLAFCLKKQKARPDPEVFTKF